jgi:hypothetical protein
MSDNGSPWQPLATIVNQRPQCPPLLTNVRQCTPMSQYQPLSLYHMIIRDDPEKILLSIAGSPWLSRLWTYEEAELAINHPFQIKDGGVDIRKLWNEWWNSVSIDLFNRLPFLLPMYLPGFVNVRRMSGPLRLCDLFEKLPWRSTSKPQDEPLCIATILDLDIQTILQSNIEQNIISLIALHPEFPSDFLFWKTRRITNERNYRCCPQSFLVIPLLETRNDESREIYGIL